MIIGLMVFSQLNDSRGQNFENVVRYLDSMYTINLISITNIHLNCYVFEIPTIQDLLKLDWNVELINPYHKRR